jgi:hypothetical protein
MANPSIKRLFGPIALTATLTTNVYQGTTGSSLTAGTNVPAGAASALIYDILKHIHVVNKTGSPATFTLYVGSTGANSAGTEFFTAQSVGANASFDWYGNLKLLSTDFIVGGASALTTLVILGEGEQYVV